MHRGRATAGAAAAALLLVAGCSAAGDGKDASQRTGGLTKDARELEARLARSKDLTYTATYERRGADGTIEELVIAQKLPRSMYRQGGTLLVDDGEKVVSCSKDGGGDRCSEVGSSTDAGVYGAASGVGFAFNPAAVLGLYTTAAVVPGVEVSRSSRDIAGQPSECASLRFTSGDQRGKRFESCTTEDGVVAFWDDGEGSVVTLTNYERDAGDPLFALPAPVGGAQGPAETTTTTKAGSTTTSRPSKSSPASSTSSTARSSSSSSSTPTSTGGPDMVTTG